MKKYSYVAVILLFALVVGASAHTHSKSLPKPTTSSDGGPIATCRPGTPCDPNTQVREMASDGGPIATCRPGTPCDPSTKLREIASDGGPIATCRPGTPCDPSTKLREMASDG